MDTLFKKIAACPFCKSDNTLVVVDMGDYWGKCRDCGATGPIRHNHDEAAEIWNRSQPAHPAENDDIFDTDPRLHAYKFAPGGYQCKCVKCKAVFHGDKRAAVCFSCAVKSLRHSLVGRDAARD